MTDKERELMQHIINVWNTFIDLEKTDWRIDDMNDFRRSLHEMQRIVAMRIVRRDYPDDWGKQ